MTSPNKRTIGIFDIFYRETPDSIIAPIIITGGELIPASYESVNDEIKKITKDPHAALHHFRYRDLYNPNDISMTPHPQGQYTSFIYIDLERPEVEDNIIKIISHLGAPIKKLLFIFHREYTIKHSKKVEERVNNFTKFKIIPNPTNSDLVQFAITLEEPYVKTIQL